MRQVIDYKLLIVMMTLITIGLVMLISTSSVIGMASFDDSYFFIKKQILFIIIGLVACWVGSKIPYQLYFQYSFYGYVLACGLLVLTLVPGVGKLAGGATRWITLGGFSLQPVEVMKFFLVVSIAGMLTNKRRLLMQFKHGVLASFFLAAIPICILFLQPDLGNSGLLLIVIGIMLFLSSIPLKHLLVVFFSTISVVVTSILLYPYQRERVLAFLNPWDDPLGRNYHMVQSLIAIGSGGVLGKGLGEGKLKYFYLPLQYSDFIFSIICEEGGLILASIILIAFSLIFMRSVIIARYAKTLFGFYLAIGLSLLLVVQAMLNIGVVMGVLPVTGIPLTFISFGGTSLIMSMFFIGVLLNISKDRY